MDSSQNSDLILYHYWRSSCSWRVRWALGHKGVTYTAVPINLLTNEQNDPKYKAINPAGFVPALKYRGDVFGESMAMLEWIEEMWPQKPLLPTSPLERMRVRQMCQMIVSGTQPIQNLSVMRKVSTDATQQSAWARYWIESGLQKLDPVVAKYSGTYSFGGNLTLADICLVPQIYNAERFQVDLQQFPNLTRIYQHCRRLKDCIAASPETHQSALNKS